MPWLLCRICVSALQRSRRTPSAARTAWRPCMAWLQSRPTGPSSMSSSSPTRTCSCLAPDQEIGVCSWGLVGTLLAAVRPVCLSSDQSQMSGVGFAAWHEGDEARFGLLHTALQAIWCAACQLWSAPLQSCTLLTCQPIGDLNLLAHTLSDSNGRQIEWLQGSNLLQTRSQLTSWERGMKQLRKSRLQQNM